MQRIPMDRASIRIIAGHMLSFQSLLAGQKLPQTRQRDRNRSPPPRERTLRNCLLICQALRQHAAVLSEANVPAEVQGLITELTEAETNASQAQPEPRHAEAHIWYEWKKALLKTSQDIAMHTALEEEQAKAKQYSAAEKTAGEKESMLAILAEQVTNVRALLDERRSQS